MRYKKVLLINPRYFNSFFKVPMWHPPVGMGYIAQSLLKHGIQYRVLDMYFVKSLKELKRQINDFKPDLIGLTMMTFGYRYLYELISEIKNSFGEIDILAGGAHISTLREEVLRQCSAIDYGCILEGEETIIELCSGKPLSLINGLIFRDKGKIMATGERPFIKDLDSLDFPRYEGFPLGKYLHKIIGIASSRGCPFECIYCPVRDAIGRSFRVRSAENIFAEVSYWYKKGYRYFDFVDDNFTLIKQRVLDFCSLMQRAGLKEINLRCPNGLRADRVDRQLLSEMRKANFSMIAFGVESGSEKVLKMMKKGEGLEKMEKAISCATELGFEVVLYFIIGTPGETPDDIEQSVQLALKYPVSDARFYNLLPFPKTELFNWVSEHKYFLKEQNDYLNGITPTSLEPVFETKELPYGERVKAIRYCRGITKRIYRKKMERKFSKYGNFSKAISYLCATDSFQNLYANNIYINKFISRLKKLV